MPFDKPLTGLGLRLFRIWLYAPYSGIFMLLGLLFLFARFPNTIGIVGFLLCVVAAISIAGGIRWIERKLGHANLTVGLTSIAFSVTLATAIAWPFLFHWVYLARSHSSTSREDLHIEMSFMIMGIMPAMLLFVKLPNPEPTEPF